MGSREAIEVDLRFIRSLTICRCSAEKLSLPHFNLPYFTFSLLPFLQTAFRPFDVTSCEIHLSESANVAHVKRPAEHQKKLEKEMWHLPYNPSNHPPYTPETASNPPEHPDSHP